MNKGLRIAVAALFLLGILVLARGQLAWAGGLPASFLRGLAQDPPLPGGGAFDFGTDTSPQASGYTRVTEAAAYSSGGFGWTSIAGLSSTDASAPPDDLRRDFVAGSAPGVFKVDLPNGMYTVTVTMGDNAKAHDNMVVKANGATVLADVDTAAGAFAVNTFTVNVSGGNLQLEFSDAGGSDPTWVVNAITIVPFAAGGPEGAAGALSLPGTVKPPPVAAPPVTSPGTYSVGGVCTFRVIQLSTDITLNADLLPYSSLATQPDNISSYQAGVCRANYDKVGVGVTDIAAPDSVQVCFAGVPNTTGKIYVYNDKTWAALATTADGGLLCAPAQQTGKYVLVTEK